MPRGRAWTQAEIRCLLALVGACGEVALLMASTSRPNEALWRDISRGLAAAGYSRSVTQCRSKWKALKQAFYSERETRRQAGRHSPRVPPHYRAMKSIWKAAGRPVFGERRLPDRVKLPPRRRVLPLEDHAPSSPEQQELVTCTDTPGTPPSQRVKDEPASHLHAAFPALKQEIAEGKAGAGVATLLQSVQQLLVQILQTSQQQQVLLESLASDTVSHLHVISDNLVQVGETLHELLLRAHARAASLPGPLDPFMSRLPLFEGGPRPPLLLGVPCCPGAPQDSPCHKEEPLGSPATGFGPP
ncbi:uncharacterized protein ACNFOS_013595 [Eudromia elegans]